MSQNGRGGKRIGAGRKKGTGAFKEPTVVKRIPISAIPTIDIFLEQLKCFTPSDALPKNSFLLNTLAQSHKIPIASDPVRAGYSTSAQANIDDVIDFNHYLSGNNDAQNIIGVYAEGNSMTDAGIDEGDLLILKTDVLPKEKDIVVVQINEDFTVKRLHFEKGQIELIPENTLENYPVIRPSANDEIRMVGIVTFVIKQL